MRRVADSWMALTNISTLSARGTTSWLTASRVASVGAARMTASTAARSDASEASTSLITASRASGSEAATRRGVARTSSSLDWATSKAPTSPGMYCSVTSDWRPPTMPISTSATTMEPMVSSAPPPSPTTIWVPMPRRPPVALRTRPRVFSGRWLTIHSKAACILRSRVPARSFIGTVSSPA